MCSTPSEAEHNGLSAHETIVSLFRGMAITELFSLGVRTANRRRLERKSLGSLITCRNLEHFLLRGLALNPTPFGADTQLGLLKRNCSKRCGLSRECFVQ